MVKMVKREIKMKKIYIMQKRWSHGHFSHHSMALHACMPQIANAEYLPFLFFFYCSQFNSLLFFYCLYNLEMRESPTRCERLCMSGMLVCISYVSTKVSLYFSKIIILCEHVITHKVCIHKNMHALKQQYPTHGEGNVTYITRVQSVREPLKSVTHATT